MCMDTILVYNDTFATNKTIVYACNIFKRVPRESNGDTSSCASGGVCPSYLSFGRI